GGGEAGVYGASCNALVGFRGGDADFHAQAPRAFEVGLEQTSVENVVVNHQQRELLFLEIRIPWDVQERVRMSHVSACVGRREHAIIQAKLHRAQCRGKDLEATVGAGPVWSGSVEHSAYCVRLMRGGRMLVEIC